MIVSMHEIFAKAIVSASFTATGYASISALGTGFILANSIIRRVQ